MLLGAAAASALPAANWLTAAVLFSTCAQWHRCWITSCTREMQECTTDVSRCRAVSTHHQSIPLQQHAVFQPWLLPTAARGGVRRHSNIVAIQRHRFRVLLLVKSCKPLRWEAVVVHCDSKPGHSPTRPGATLTAGSDVNAVHGRFDCKQCCLGSGGCVVEQLASKPTCATR